MAGQRRPHPPPVDALYAELMQAGESVKHLRGVLGRGDLEQTLLLAVLRRPVPVRFLELVAATVPWTGDPRILGAVVLNPRAPRSLALGLIGSLFWRDLADVAASPRLTMAVRARAEGALKDMLPQMRLGEKVTLAKMATPPVLTLLLADTESKVAQASLINPRLREEDLLTSLRQDTVPLALLSAVTESTRWNDRYHVRLALVLQPRTPLSLALGQLSSLMKRDLERVADTPALLPLVRAAARRVAQSGPDE